MTRSRDATVYRYRLPLFLNRFSPGTSIIQITEHTALCIHPARAAQRRRQERPAAGVATCIGTDCTYGSERLTHSRGKQRAPNRHTSGAVCTTRLSSRIPIRTSYSLRRPPQYALLASSCSVGSEAGMQPGVQRNGSSSATGRLSLPTPLATTPPAPCLATRS